MKADALKRLNEARAFLQALTYTGPKWRREQPQLFQGLLWFQREMCPICLVRFGGAGLPVVDHCHESGLVRGLLCSGCNSNLERRTLRRRSSIPAEQTAWYERAQRYLRQPPILHIRDREGVMAFLAANGAENLVQEPERIHTAEEWLRRNFPLVPTSQPSVGAGERIIPMADAIALRRAVRGADLQ